MPNIGPMELVVVLIIALLVLGPRKLPEVGRSLGRGIREFRHSLRSDTHEGEAVELREELSAAEQLGSRTSERRSRARTPAGAEGEG